MSAPTVAEWLVTHPFANPETVEPPDVEAAYHLNQGENVLVDISITDENDDPIPAASIASVNIQLKRNEVQVLLWSWFRAGSQSPQIEVADGHVYLEISASDTLELAGLYDMLIQLSIDNMAYFYSSAQSTVIEAHAALFIPSAPVTPP